MTKRDQVARKDNSTQDKDWAIYRGLCQRDPQALEQLIHRYSRKLMVMIRRVLGKLGNVNDAMEVLSDTFIAAWYEIEKYDPERAPLATWLWMRAKYLALDRRRVLSRPYHTVPLEETHLPMQSHQESWLRAQDWDLHTLLNNLPELDRELIYRRYALQETLQEIAQEVDISVDGVRNRLWRIRRRLYKQLQPPPGSDKAVEARAQAALT
jgi:RNA polymerase sigma-70 factor (ECF subfamily)